MESKSKTTNKTAFPRRAVGLRRMDGKFQATSKFETPEIVHKDVTESQKRNENNKDKIHDNHQKNTCESLTEINLDCSMSKSIEDALFYFPLQTANVNAIKSITDCSNNSSILKLSTDSKQSLCLLDDDHFKVDSILPKPKMKTLSIKSKGISLKDFETHREITAEQKVLRKEVLNNANKIHLKKPVSLTTKLDHIKMELNRLEQNFVVDIGLLRRQIEEACTHFANTGKRYTAQLEKNAQEK